MSETRTNKGMNKWMNERKNKQTNEWASKQANEWTDGQTDEQTNESGVTEEWMNRKYEQY